MERSGVTGPAQPGEEKASGTCPVPVRVLPGRWNPGSIWRCMSGQQNIMVINFRRGVSDQIDKEKMLPHEDCKALGRAVQFLPLEVFKTCLEQARTTRSEFSVNPSWSRRWTRNLLMSHFHPPVNRAQWSHTWCVTPCDCPHSMLSPPVLGAADTCHTLPPALLPP